MPTTIDLPEDLHNQAIAACPITQGRLVRLLLCEGQSLGAALKAIDGLSQHDRHEFWPDTLAFTEIETTGVIGHRQVALARSHRARLVTFDKGLAAMHPDPRCP